MDLTGLDRALARVCEITMVSPIIRHSDVLELLKQAQSVSCYGIGLPSSCLAQAYDLLEDDTIKLSCLVGFPFGMTDADVKRYETEAAVDLGVHEIEVWMNLGKLKDGQHQSVLRELRDVAEAADERPVKVALEPRLLSAPELETACQLILDSGAQMITLQQAGISPEIVSTVRQFLGKNFGVKAAGFRQFGSAQGLLEAGATRLGHLSIKG